MQHGATDAQRAIGNGVPIIADRAPWLVIQRMPSTHWHFNHALLSRRADGFVLRAVSDLVQRLHQVGLQIVDVLDANRQSHHVLAHPRLGQFGRIELAVRGRCRVRGQ